MRDRGEGRTSQEAAGSGTPPRHTPDPRPPAALLAQRHRNSDSQSSTASRPLDLTARARVVIDNVDNMAPDQLGDLLELAEPGTRSSDARSRRSSVAHHSARSADSVTRQGRGSTGCRWPERWPHRRSRLLQRQCPRGPDDRPNGRFVPVRPSRLRASRPARRPGRRRGRPRRVGPRRRTRTRSIRSPRRTVTSKEAGATPLPTQAHRRRPRPTPRRRSTV